jgi:Met-zincin
MHTVRDLPGSVRATYQPVDPVQQRAALRLLSDAMFTPDSFRFRPEFLAAAGPDYTEWERSGPVNIPEAVLQLQTRTLDRLLSAGTAQRVLDQPSYLPEGRRRSALTLDEVYGSLQSSIWTELRQGGEIERLRRNLQREYLKRVQVLLTKGGALPADALSLVRWHAQRLQVDLRTAAARSKLSVDTRAHLQESLSGLTEALRATMQRG